MTMRITLRLARRCLAALLVAALASCRTTGDIPVAIESQPRTAEYGDTVTLAIGASVRLAPAGTLVSFDKVLSDSRCRPEMMCVWAGSVRVRLTVSENAGSATAVELESNFDPRSVVVGAYRLRLLPEVEPAPGSPGPYVIRLLISSP